MIYMTCFASIFFFISAFLFFPSKKKQDKVERLSVYLGEDEKEMPLSVALRNKRKLRRISLSFLTKFWNDIKILTKPKLSEKHNEKLEDKLLKAGSPFNLSPVDFQLVKVVSLIGMALFCGLFSLLLHLSKTSALMFICFGLVYGGGMPSLLLNSRIKRRKKESLRELPDFVDLLTVSLEAGLGFDSALSKVLEKQKGVLSDEFRLCLDEIRLGKTRREGLTGVKKRVGVEEITTLINSVIRAERLGVGMVQVLRIQSEEVRQKRRQRAEEQAMKAPIKMLFPLVLFIFPSLFIIILGPAVIQILHVFSGGSIVSLGG